MTYADFYQPGVPREIDAPTQSLVHLYESAVASGKKLVATDFFGRTLTYAQVGAAIERAAEGLRRLGVRPGDRVALVLPNCPQHAIAFYAVLRLGAIVVEHNPLYTARELRHMFEDHAAQVAIVWDVAVERVRDQPRDIAPAQIVSVKLLAEFPLTKRLALRLPLPRLRHLRRRLTSKAKATMTWRKLLSSGRLKHNHPRPAVTDVAAIQYTSGTSGTPKGAVLTHANLYSNALQADAWMHDARTGEETLYAILPFFHALGLTSCLTYGFMKQSRMVIFPTFDIDSVMSTIKRRPPTVLCAVPPIFEAIANAAQKHHRNLSAIRICLSGAMAASAQVRERWSQTHAGDMIEGYGLTECSPIALGNPFYSTRKPGTVGLPFPSTEIRVVDIDDPGHAVTSGQRGELLIRGPQVFRGYWNNPTATGEALLEGGWLATGDIVTEDEEGFVTIVDRKKELIITGGFNVAPTEVELVLDTHPDIVRAAVVGLPHAHSGEEVVAAVVLKPDRALDDRQIRSYCRARLAAYKVPRRIIQVEAIPQTLLGKIQHSQVRQSLLDGQHR
ncbi:MAG: AMP-binding protein [Propionibacteriaceae bacterium]|nr:AMP-binding protein [Propionibacteriaceae bacterium]